MHSSSNSLDRVTCTEVFSDESFNNEHYSDGKLPSDISSWRKPVKSKSEPQLHVLSRQETFSVCSEPNKRTSQKVYATMMPDLLRSISDVGVWRTTDDLHSSRSIGETLFYSSNNADPVVIFWGKSDKRETIESTLIGKFILKTGEVFTYAFNRTSKVSEMKHIISDMFKVPIETVQLKHNDEILEESTSISDLTIERFGCVTFQLVSIDPDRYPLEVNNVYPDIPTNDVLTVIVNEGVRSKEVIVEIENRVVCKPFLGGYRHRITGLEYHHAFTQTAPRAHKNNIVSRNTQTLGMNKFMNTTMDKIIQTSHVSSERQNNGYKILEGDPERRKKREDEELKALQGKIILIQRNLRSWLVKKMMLKMKEEYKKCIEWENREKCKKVKEREERIQSKENAISSPKSRGDFELLYHNLEEWRHKEALRISKIESIAVRKAEQCNALETEIKIINSIEKHRIKRKEHMQKKEREKLLEKTAAPLHWKGSDGRILWMDSLGTQRARKMRNLYASLQGSVVDPKERITALQMVKEFVQKFENNTLVPELISLLDRESHILARNLSQVKLSTLRDRIRYLFVELIRDPTVNPEATKYTPREMCQRTPMYKCVSCQNIQPYHKFSLHTKTDDYRRCVNCSWLRSVGGPRIEVNPVRHIMNAVRREELHRSDYTSVALVMQEQDFYHLIVNIWLGHSAIGGSGNLEELRLGRWDFSQIWSPWNCILLTAEELKAHLRFSNPEQIYSLSFVKKIKQRHQMGRIHFSELADYSIKIASDNVQVSKMIDNFGAVKVHTEREK